MENNNDPLKGFSLFNGNLVGNIPVEVKEEKLEEQEEDEIISTPNPENLKTAGKVDKVINNKVGEEPDETENSEEKEEESTEEVEEESEENEEDNQEEEEQQYIPILNHFNSKGILDIPEEIEDTEEGFEKTIEYTVNNRVKTGIENELSILGDKGKEFLEFVKSGGKPEDYIEMYFNPVSWENFTPENEEDYKYIIKQSLINLEDYTAEEADEVIEDFEKTESIEKHGKKHLSKLQKLEITEKENRVKTQIEANKKILKQREEAYNSFKENLLKKEEISGFKLTPKDRSDLLDYMTKVDKKTGKTAYQSAIETKEDSNMLYAYIAMKGFNLEKLEKQVKTKVVSNLANKLKNINTSDSRSKLKNGQTDSFEEEKKEKSGNLKGFRKLI